MDPAVSPEDIDALIKLGGTAIMSTVHSALSPQERETFFRLSAKVVKAAPKKPRKPRGKKPLAKSAQEEKRLAEAKAAKKLEVQSRFMSRLFAAEAVVMQNVQLWEQGQSLIAADIHSIDNEKIPNEQFGNKSKICFFLLPAIQYVQSAIVSQSAIKTLEFYNACIIGRRLHHSWEWWQRNGKEEGAFPKWVQKNFVGDEFGKIKAKDAPKYVTLGKFQKTYPKIIFISTISWKELVKQPGTLHQFILEGDHARRMFWTSANVKMQFKASDGQMVAGPHLLREGTTEPEFAMDLEPVFHQVLELENERQEQMRLTLTQHENEQREMNGQVESGSSTDSVSD